MIARLLATGLLLLGLSAAAPADWTKVVRATPALGRLVGNPAAPVKLIEFAAYTCPHCAHFSGQAAAPIAQAIRSGRLAVEYRPIVFDRIGMAATVVARCVPLPRFLSVNDALYARQDEWHRRTHDYADDNASSLSRYSTTDQLQELAVQGGIAAVAGLSEAQANACFANQQLIADTARAADAAGVIASSTPTFVVAGQKYAGLDWAALSTKLRAAGLK